MLELKIKLYIWTEAELDEQCGLIHFIIPTNAHNVKTVALLKHIKIMEAAPTCFGLQRNHPQEATATT